MAFFLVGIRSFQISSGRELLIFDSTSLISNVIPDRLTLFNHPDIDFQPPEKTAVIFAFRQPSRGLNGVKYVAKTGTV